MSVDIRIRCNCSDDCPEQIFVSAATPWDARTAAEREGWGTETPRSLTYDVAPGHVLEFEAVNG